MIQLRNLTKQYGNTVAVNGIDLVVEPGRVTGFLGPNGAGKSTTMRMILGLDRPTAGEVLVNGGRYRDARAPLREIGGLLEARAIHPGRSARSHLRQLAASNRIAMSRVDDVLDVVGLSDVAHKRAGKFSLGMGQRLGIAAALLGDPGIVMLDEPVNGLDPEGIRWVRSLARQLADEGRTVFISSHLMSEMALMADHLVVIGRGAVIADQPLGDFMAEYASNEIVIRSPELAKAAEVLAGPSADMRVVDDRLLVRGLDPEYIGDAMHAAGIRVHELTINRSSLEDVFMELTADSVQFSTSNLEEVSA